MNWTMDEPNTFTTKLMSIFGSMDKMAGRDFETGLSQLKSAAERQS